MNSAMLEALFFAYKNKGIWFIGIEEGIHPSVSKGLSGRGYLLSRSVKSGKKRVRAYTISESGIEYIQTRKVLNAISR